MNSTIVGLDIGTTKVTAVVGEIQEDGSVNVIGVGITPSEGMEKGKVKDVEKATQSIQKALDEAQRMADLAVDYVYIGIAGDHIESFNNTSSIQLNPGASVTKADVDRVINEARKVNVPQNKEMIHSIVREFKLDGQDGLSDPVGMIGSRLEVSVHLVFAATNSIKNFVACAHKLDLDVADVILQPLASAEAVLAEDEKKMGVILVDIGGGTTDVAAFCQGRLSHTFSLPIGGNHFTSDLAYFCRTGIADAEKLKIRYGSVDERLVEKNLGVEITTVGTDEKRKISADSLVQVLEPRGQELVKFVLEGINQTLGNLDQFAAGIVITGGGAQIRGMDHIFKKMSGLPVRIGKTRRVTGLVEKVQSPIFATVVGLILFGFRHHESLNDNYKDEGFFQKIVNTVKSWFI